MAITSISIAMASMSRLTMVVLGRSTMDMASIIEWPWLVVLVGVWSWSHASLVVTLSWLIVPNVVAPTMANGSSMAILWPWLVKVIYKLPVFTLKVGILRLLVIFVSDFPKSNWNCQHQNCFLYQFWCCITVHLDNRDKYDYSKQAWEKP